MKTPRRRKIQLGIEGVRILRGQASNAAMNEKRVFPLLSQQKLARHFKAAVKRVGLSGITMHDLRRSALSKKVLGMAPRTLLSGYVRMSDAPSRKETLRQRPYEERVAKAAAEYIMRREGIVIPSGVIAHDRAFAPGKEELQQCCRELKQRTEASSRTMLKHCRSARHVANIFDVKERDIRTLSNAENLTRLKGVDPDLDAYIEKNLKDL